MTLLRTAAWAILYPALVLLALAVIAGSWTRPTSPSRRECVEPDAAP